MKFDTKIAIILRQDLATWQKLNMTAFLVSGIAAQNQVTIGEDYQDGSGQVYWPMFRQPVMVFGGTSELLRAAYDKAIQREVKLALFTHDLFSTGHDEANRAAVQAVMSDQLDLTGLAMWADKKQVDAITKGLSLHP